ncbi:MAG: hypothetical protein JKY56_12490 [Kofleriaceae bacterium]|nr:hypothetical protein [Kofleriaceae bacterium]
MSLSRRETVLLALVSCLPLAACEAPVKSSSAQSIVLQKPSLEMESCDNSGQCAGELRCIDATCQSLKRSRLGDFYAEAGRVAMLGIDPMEPSIQFNAAVAQYDSEGLELPIDVLCGQGSALAMARADVKLGEAGARVLHRCLLKTPPNSSIARSALRSLVSLSEAGLDPTVLARDEIGDLYLSGDAMVTDPVEVQVAFQDDGKASKKRGFGSLMAALQGAGSLSAMKSCFPSDAKGPVAVELAFSFRYFMDEDDEARDRFVLSLESESGSSSAASTCVHAATQVVIDSLGKTIRDRGKWKSSVTVTLSSQ